MTRKGLQWTEEQRVVYQLYDEGKTTQEIIDLGHSVGMANKVRTARNQGQKPPPLGELQTQTGDGDGNKPAAGAQKTRGGIEIGKITITPENWGMSQYGAIAVLDTYTKAKKIIGYTGTVADFLVDVCLYFRKMVGLEEVILYDSRSEGEGGDRQDGESDAGETIEVQLIG